MQLLLLLPETTCQSSLLKIGVAITDVLKGKIRTMILLPSFVSSVPFKRALAKIVEEEGPTDPENISPMYGTLDAAAGSFDDS